MVRKGNAMRFTERREFVKMTGRKARQKRHEDESDARSDWGF